MKFVKENMILVICGAVVVLALISIWYPTLTWEADYAAQKGGYYKDQASEITNKTNTQLVMEGIPAEVSTTGPATAPAYVVLNGIPTPNLTADRTQANAQMKTQAEHVIQRGAEANKNNRINARGVPLMNGKAEAGYLPKITNAVDPEEFKKDYKAQFDHWLSLLAGQNHGVTYPPTAEDLTNAWQDKQKRDSTGRPAGMGTDNNQPNNKEQNDFNRGQIMSRATGTHMYVDMGPPIEGAPANMLYAFQIRPWAAEQAPPNEQQIFEALVDSWFQSDVVNAIKDVNDTALAAVADSTKRNVGAAPIKRLMHIAVGNPDANVSRLGSLAQGGGGMTGGLGAPVGGGGAAVSAGLWYLPAAVATAAPTADGTPPAAGTGVNNTIDFSRTLTGRASGNDYDVVQMQIWMDIDPAYLNKFVESLYKQNMGYTVLQIKFKTVDPLDRASNGFIYGDTQVIEVEILVEGLLFRNWTVPLMPPSVMSAVGAVLPTTNPAN